MANFTTCAACGALYEAEEQADEPERLCPQCREAPPPDMPDMPGQLLMDGHDSEGDAAP